MEITRLYRLRFEIEHGFKQAVHLIGTFAYHFWMRNMKPLRRRNGNQYLHRESPRPGSHILHFGHGEYLRLMRTTAIDGVWRSDVCSNVHCCAVIVRGQPSSVGGAPSAAAPSPS